MWFAAFFGEEKSFSVKEQIWKLPLGGATIRAVMPEKIVKVRENGCKDCAHHFDHLEAR